MQGGGARGCSVVPSRRLLAGGVTGGEEGRENAKKRNVHKEEGARG